MRILVVDDDPSAGNLLEIALRRLGHEPVLALHPDDAIELFEPAIDAMISDIEMPRMNGVELARTLRAKRKDLPIVFCTGSDPTEGVAAEAAQIGRVFPKRWSPTHVEELIAELRRH